MFIDPPSLDPEDPQSIYRKQFKTRSQVMPPTPEMLTVLVNGVPTALPAIHTRGDFYTWISEFWFLDQAGNPLALKYLIGTDLIPPLSAEDKAKCASDAELVGYLPQNCLHPDGGAQTSLTLVKINHRCAAAPPPGGEGGESPSAAGGGELPALAGSAAGSGTGGGEGIEGSGEAQLEEALLNDGRGSAGCLSRSTR